jgi:bifunctional non-homologous end joining protein LigD
MSVTPTPTSPLVLPSDPMKPIISEDIPTGEDWGYQLKWDGVRMLARIEDGRVELFSRKLLPKNNAYPELVRALTELKLKGPLLLDGEVVVFDTVKQRPVFQKVLQRERLRTASNIQQAGAKEPVQFVLFDILNSGGVDFRDKPYKERHEELLRLFPEKQERLFVTDLFHDGHLLWNWVEQRGWEGIVSKRLSSTYKEGKKHKDWFKKKTALQLEVDILGYTFNDGRLASLIMASDGYYFGRVSLGLNEELKRKLMERSLKVPAIGRGAGASGPFSALPSDLKGITLAWLEQPFRCTVTGLEVTDAGLLRHPKLVSLPV